MRCGSVSGHVVEAVIFGRPSRTWRRQSLPLQRHRVRRRASGRTAIQARTTCEGDAGCGFLMKAAAPGFSLRVAPLEVSAGTASTTNVWGSALHCSRAAPWAPCPGCTGGPGQCRGPLVLGAWVEQSLTQQYDQAAAAQGAAAGDRPPYSWRTPALGPRQPLSRPGQQETVG